MVPLLISLGHSVSFLRISLMVCCTSIIASVVGSGVARFFFSCSLPLVVMALLSLLKTEKSSSPVNIARSFRVVLSIYIKSVYSRLNDSRLPLYDSLMLPFSYTIFPFTIVCSIVAGKLKPSKGLQPHL